MVAQGSTSLKLASGLRHGGLKTGLFVSPHISSYRERIQVDGELIAEAALLVKLRTYMTMRY
jgi:dihydrofolate synthase/folylpolyglutamate synthase